jgi:hypothetical protein
VSVQAASKIARIWPWVRFVLQGTMAGGKPAEGRRNVGVRVKLRPDVDVVHCVDWRIMARESYRPVGSREREPRAGTAGASVDAADLDTAYPRRQGEG